MIVNSKKNMNTAETAESLRFTDVATPRAETLFSYCVCNPNPTPIKFRKTKKRQRKTSKKRRKEKSVCVINGYVA